MSGRGRDTRAVPDFGLKKCSLLNGQLSLVIDGGASRNLFFKDDAPKAHPKMTNDNCPLSNEHFYSLSAPHPPPPGVSIERTSPASSNVVNFPGIS